MSVYTGIKGKNYILGKQLGAGGEGTVYEIQGDDTKVAKLYKPNKFTSNNDRLIMERKLQTMINMKVASTVNGKLYLAWPVDILYENGLMVGFVMPKIASTCKIFDVQRCWRAEPNNPSTKAILQVYPEYTWKYAVQFAYNLASVIEYVHSLGIVIGDLNQNNIYIDTSTSAVVLIDCDSFDITNNNTGERFACEVGFTEMLAPELQTVGSLKGKFTKYTDDFSLAIHIFRLLMRNADPFGGIPSAGASSSAITNANVDILSGNCPYVRACNKTIPGWAPDLSILPTNIQNLFRKTFDYNQINFKNKISQRATASEWKSALASLSAAEPNPYLHKCAYNQYHVYAAHNAYCPWCKCENWNSAQRQTSYGIPTPKPNAGSTYVSSNNTYSSGGNTYNGTTTGSGQGGNNSSKSIWHGLFGAVALIAIIVSLVLGLKSCSNTSTDSPTIVIPQQEDSVSTVSIDENSYNEVDTFSEDYSNNDSKVYKMCANSEWMHDVESDFKESIWGQTEYNRRDVTSIRFQKSLENMPDNAWDVSANQDKTIMAWITDDSELVVASEGTIALPDDSNYYFSDFNNVTTIDFADAVDTSNITDMSGLFNCCVSLKELDFSNFDTSNVTDMSSMFCTCDTLTTLDLSTFDTSNVTDMCGMFSGCIELTTLDIGNFNTSNVTNMAAMFSGCYSIASLNLSNFDTSNATSMSGMFSACTSLTTLDLSNFDTSNVMDMGYMFEDCESLTSLDLSNFDTSDVTTMYSMFSVCQNLTILDISSFNADNVTDLEWMFYNCDRIQSLKCSDSKILDAYNNRE